MKDLEINAVIVLKKILSNLNTENLSNSQRIALLKHNIMLIESKGLFKWKNWISRIGLLIGLSKRLIMQKGNIGYNVLDDVKLYI